MRNRFCLFSSSLVLGLGFLSWARAARTEPIVQFEKLQGEELQSEPFTLRRPLTLHVHCEGAGDGDDEGMYAYGWILDRRTRNVVWALTPQRAQEQHDRNYIFDGEVPLPAGDYVAAYAAYGLWRSHQKIFKFMDKEIWRFEVDSDRYKRALRNSKSWGMRIDTRTPEDMDAVESGLPTESPDARVVVQMIDQGDDEFQQQGFTLKERMTVTVYCLGEWDAGNQSMADGGWILDADSRRRIWALGPDNFKHAGGAPKNKVARETITLSPGNYLVYYSCDGSHSSGAWNAPPPYDPDFWGITVWAGSAEQARRVQPYEEDAEGRAIVSLIKQGSDAYDTQGFTVARSTPVRVYALGEFAHGEFADQGWIESYDTHRRVWEMTERNTQPAGGSSKNRFADEIVNLPAGDFVLYYQTDGSHAYQDWNDSPPHDPSHWGITLYGVGRKVDPSNFKLFDPEMRSEAGKQYLVRMIKIGNDADEEREFELVRPTRVHIVALGEGTDQMYDYGWIEDQSTGTTVWEMTLRNTRKAGGAEKNRLFDGVLLLDKGRYVAHYVTDGSHSWGDWNQPPPPEPYQWGLTILAEPSNP